MIWSVKYQNHGEFLEDRDDHPGRPNDNREALEQFAKVAKRVVDSAAVGAGTDFVVSLSGHANPGHRPANGSANDTLTVTVAQAARKPKS
jgi:hypothetical protein